MRRPALLAAVALAAAGLAVAGPAPSAGAAGACTSEVGVTVVADFNELGGGVQGTCVANGADRPASQLFPAAGFPLSYASRQPGFVCRVSGVPQSDPCVNTAPQSAFWGLWWSDGDPGAHWSFSSLGATSLRIPDGGLVAFAWDQQSGDQPPDASPTRPRAAPTPSSPPTTRATGTPAPPSGSPAQPPSPPPPSSSQSRGPDATLSATPTPSVTTPATELPPPSQSRTPHPRATATDDVTPTESAYPELAEPASPRDDGAADAGLAGWVAPVVVVVLFGVAGGVLLVRRRRTTP